MLLNILEYFGRFQIFIFSWFMMFLTSLWLILIGCSILLGSFQRGGNLKDLSNLGFGTISGTQTLESDLFTLQLRWLCKVPSGDIWDIYSAAQNTYPQPRKSLQHVLWNYTSQWKRSATTPNPAWPCNTALPNGTLAIRCSISYLQKASFGSTSQWKRWWQTLQQSLCPWTSFYHRWSSSTQWHRTHCSTMFPSYQHDLATQRFPMER